MTMPAGDLQALFSVQQSSLAWSVFGLSSCALSLFMVLEKLTSCGTCQL